MNFLLPKIFRQSLFSMAVLCSLSACQTTMPNANEQFTKVAQSIVHYRESTSPYSSPQGLDDYLLANLSPEYLEQEYKNKIQLKR